MVIGGFLGEAAEHHQLDAIGRSSQFRGDGTYRDSRGTIGWKSINPGRDRWKCHRRQPTRGGKIERGAIAGCQQILFALAAAAPRRPHGVDHMLRRQPIAAGDLCSAGLAAAEGSALGQQFRSRGAMDGAVDAAAPKQRAVCRIDDRVKRKRRDIGNTNLEPGGADFSGKQRRHLRHS